MRIIAGSARGTNLEVGAGSTARPFLELARGALFNSLGGEIIDARILDLYAGSGALGLEALSRGGAACVFVERDRASIRALMKNIGKCRMESCARVVRSDVGVAVAMDDGEYDVIFIDPPFPELAEWTPGGGAERIMRESARLLSAEGVLVFRYEEGKAPPPEWPGLVLVKDKRYGRSRVCRYGRAAADATQGSAR